MRVLDRDEVLREIDEVLARCGATPDRPIAESPMTRAAALQQTGRLPPERNKTQMVMSLLNAIERNAPLPSTVAGARAIAYAPNGRLTSLAPAVEGLVGVLMSVRQDIEMGYFRTLEDRARDELSGDLLETASSFVKKNEGAAIVLAVSVLEEHVRKLAEARDIETRTAKGAHRSFDEMTVDLKAHESGISSTEQRTMGGWYAHRTAAAHGNFDELTPGVGPGIIDGVRAIMLKHPS